MFESDDFDEILSQVDFTEFDSKPKDNEKQHVLRENFNENSKKEKNSNTKKLLPGVENHALKEPENTNITNQNVSCETSASKSSTSPEHCKRKIINSYFVHNSKRKFPGPAGLLSGNFDKNNDSICNVELLSQDIDFTQNYLHGNVFDTPIWKRILTDTESLKEMNCIKFIKHQALNGNLRNKKAQFVRAFIESVDRSAIDPLITLRDETGNIKCTLHRDAWTAFSTYIASEFCALVLCKPSVLTIGRASKNHYLNITLSNIYTIYSSAVDGNDALPDGCQRVDEDNCIIVKLNRSDLPANDTAHDLDYLQDLDEVFLDDMF